MAVKTGNNTTRILIEELMEKSTIENDNLMIVEDEEDTKKASIYKLKKSFSGDSMDPTDDAFYTSKKIAELLDNVNRELANKMDLKQLADLIAKINSLSPGLVNPDGTVNPEDEKPCRHICQIYVLKANKWNQNTKKYNLEEDYPAEDFNIEVSLSDTCNAQQFEAFGKAKVVGNHNRNILTAYGKVPTIDIPVIVDMFDKREIEEEGTGPTLTLQMKTLYDKLDFDKAMAESTYVKKIRRTLTGSDICIPNHYGFLDLAVTAKNGGVITDNNVQINVHSKNLIDATKIVAVANQVTKLTSGFRYNQVSGGTTTVRVPLDMIYPAGVYNLLAHITFSATFTDKRNIKLLVKYSDGTVDQVSYNHEENFKFDARKGFNEINLVYNAANLVDNSYVVFESLMLVEHKRVPDKYIPFFSDWRLFSPESGTKIFTINDVVNNDYTYKCYTNSCQITLTYYDNEIDMEYVYNKLNDVKKVVSDKIDNNSLITDTGIIQFPEEMYVAQNEDAITISDGEIDYIRNGIKSKKITVNDMTGKVFSLRIPMDETINIIETVSLLFFIDKSISAAFPDKSGGLKLRLSSDPITVSKETSYYEYMISKTEMYHGWNCIKRKLVDFTSVGNPDPNNIKFISIESATSYELNGKSFYINSVTFNQKAKPKLLLSFNGLYDETFSYLIPYLKTRGIRGTIFINNKRDLSAETADRLMELMITHKWDIALDSCHPNKEVLSRNDNYRNQYMAIKNSHEWMRDNLLNSPSTFCGAYGDLRDITAPILKDFGYKMVRVDANTYCSIFTKDDFIIPAQLLSNKTTIEEIVQKIDYAISTGQTISLYTNDVTEYGSEIDSKKIMLESIVNYIMEKVENGDIECVTYNDFYKMCTT